MYSRRVPLLASFVMATQKEMKDTAWKAEPETLLELLDSSSRSTSYKTTLSPAVTKHFSSGQKDTSAMLLGDCNQGTLATEAPQCSHAKRSPAFTERTRRL